MECESASIYTKLPSRSSLYSLKPVGIGTPHCESLTSYASRLAYAHSVSPKILLRFVYSKPQVNSAGFQTCNGYGKYAKTFASRFSELTGVGNLTSLTMLPWKPIFNNMGHGLLSVNKRWCPLCFYAQTQDTGTLTEPLLWQIRMVNVCPIHNTKLVSACHSCYSKQFYLSSRAEIGICNACGAPLSQQETSPLSENCSKLSIDESPNLWIANAVSEMIAASDKLPANFSSAFLSQALLKLVDKNRYKSKAELCRELGINLCTFSQWQMGRFLPNFDIFLNFCHRINLSPVSLILLRQPMPTSINGQPSNAIWRKKIQYSESFRKSIDKALKQHLKDNNPQSLKAIARKYNCGVTYLRLTWPKLSSLISKRFKEYRRQKSLEKARAAMNGTIKAFNAAKSKYGISSKRVIFNELVALKEKHYGNNQKTYKLIQYVQGHAGSPPNMEA